MFLVFKNKKAFESLLRVFRPSGFIFSLGKSFSNSRFTKDCWGKDSGCCWFSLIWSHVTTQTDSIARIVSWLLFHRARARGISQGRILNLITLQASRDTRFLRLWSFSPSYSNFFSLSGSVYFIYLRILFAYLETGSFPFGLTCERGEFDGWEPC